MSTSTPSRGLAWPLAHLAYSTLVATLSGEAGSIGRAACCGSALIGPVAAAHASRVMRRAVKRWPLGLDEQDAAMLGGVLGAVGGCVEGALVGSVSSAFGRRAGIKLAVTIAVVAEAVEWGTGL